MKQQPGRDRALREQILIVDGYNVIFSWPELKKLSKQSLEHARMRLADMLQNYGRHKGYSVILVFDGKYAMNAEAFTERLADDFMRVYTTEGETADSFIERTVYELKVSYKTVSVCTSDYAEQIQVLGSGALRVSSRELKARVERAKLDEKKYYVGFRKGAATKLNRNEFGKHLDGEVADKWEGIRRGKPKLK